MADSMKMDMMKNKDASKVTIEAIEGHESKVESSLTGANGAVQRQFSILAPKIIYQMLDSDNSPGRTMTVPSAGKMLVRDHRPPAAPKPGDKPKKEGDDDQSRGDTAFQWQKQLIYSENQHRADMTGDVVIIHQLDGKESADGPIRINADTVTAWFEPNTPDAKPPAATPGAQTDSSMHLKRLTANGNVNITRADSHLTADNIEYDPASHWMIAHGSDTTPAHLEDPDPKRNLTAQDLQWNTLTWDVKASGPRAANPR